MNCLFSRLYETWQLSYNLQEVPGAWLISATRCYKWIKPLLFGFLNLFSCKLKCVHLVLARLTFIHFNNQGKFCTLYCLIFLFSLLFYFNKRPSLFNFQHHFIGELSGFEEKNTYFFFWDMDFFCCLKQKSHSLLVIFIVAVFPWPDPQL